ncbi:MAG: hypothetical protein DBX47_05940 [Clostridiales bacterium]|nr:MAG: hypothetical protein DBX47_05940 [Clostridiales bacterium]
MKKNDYYAAALRRLSDYRCSALQKQADNIATAYKKIPKLAEIDIKLKKNMREFMEASMSDNFTDEQAQKYSSRSLDLQATRAEMLYEKGFPIGFMDVQYHCTECEDEGYINGRMCKCLKKLIADEYMKNSNIATNYRNRTFKNVDLSLFGNENEKTMKLIVSFCKKYVKEFTSNKQNLFFAGVPGSGKTFMSTVIGTELINSDVFVFYTSSQDMISSFEAEKFGKDISSAVETDLYTTCELLIIDDLGTEFNTPFAESVIYNVINTRINKSLPIIISSNYTPEEFEGMYNDRLISRINYDFTLISFPDIDIRKKKKEK